MLQRQIDVLADLLTFRHRVEHIVCDRRWIEIQHADPLEPVNSIEGSKQSSQRSTLAAIDAVERRIL